MSTSIFEGYIRGDLSNQIASQEPVDTAVVRDQIVNNLLHLADESSQVLVAYYVATADEQNETLAAANTWYPLMRWGPFPCRTKGTGDLYPLRVRVGGYSSAGHSVTFGLVWAPSKYSAEAELAHAGTNVFTLSTTDTTENWLGPSAGTACLTMPEDRAYDCIRSINTIDAVSGKSVSIDVAFTYVDLWVKTANVSSQPVLTGLYAAEYYAP